MGWDSTTHWRNDNNRAWNNKRPKLNTYIELGGGMLKSVKTNQPIKKCMLFVDLTKAYINLGSATRVSYESHINQIYIQIKIGNVLSESKI